MPILQNKWVLTTKIKANGTVEKFKARLVNGFQQTPRIYFFETFSPVVKASTIRVFFTLVVSKGWDIK